MGELPYNLELDKKETGNDTGMIIDFNAEEEELVDDDEDQPAE
jgi:hypothetical protein